jgi:hypothetical protein
MLWLTPIILATQKARRIMVQSQPRQIVCKTLSQKYATQKRTGRVAQGVGTESNPSTAKKKASVQSIYRPFVVVAFNP